MTELRKREYPGFANHPDNKCACPNCNLTEPGLWWLSFCDDTEAGRGRFLGAVIMTVPAHTSLIRHSYHMGLNPGGEMLAIELDPKQHRFTPDQMFRLLNKKEAESLANAE